VFLKAGRYGDMKRMFLGILVFVLLGHGNSFAQLSGDFNGDGHVNVYDLSIIANHWLESLEPTCTGDTDGDCDADLVDFEDLSSNFVTTVCSEYTASASSQENGSLTAANAIDGTLSSRWSSAFADNQWLQIDLGQIRTFSSLQIAWEDAYAEEYDISVSDDASSWVTVYSTTTGDGDYDDISFSTTTARYVRINCITRATQWGNSIREVFVATEDICTPADGWTLIWADEFNGPNINTSNWQHQTGDSGWGNNELQYYTDRTTGANSTRNSWVENGCLVIQALRENYEGRVFTSARITSADMQSFQYGKLEARIKLPTGQGMWPAFWMMPDNYQLWGWPICGEIDIMESINAATDTFGALHYGAAWPGHESASADYTEGTPGNWTDFSEDFHIFTLQWTPTRMSWLVDGNAYLTFGNWWSSSGPYPEPFDKRFHFIMNIAVGGNWPRSEACPGCSASDTSWITATFPQQMLFDWVRVYKR
jgi:beta-glucanase (GH16 family)